MVQLFFICVLSYDIWYYMVHIFLHNKNIYFIHKIHHKKSYNDLTYVDTNVSHILETPLQTIGLLIPFIIYKIEYLSLIYAYIFILIRGYMEHDKRCVWLIGNHHLLHHRYPKYNFGEYWIDYLCNTKYPNDDEYIYGIIYT